ncbi:MAG TPA: acyl-CoA dehydrogenase family protein [Acidimicrobiales bacterium]|jgi:alkylation response protein AidB-like acyl-CoA dehydrogenase|nr:acyl-CoA dehydrogenase family protein [Acidimicrobiales bacterium]
MDFELSDDQQALRDAARELLDDRAGAAQVRAVVDAGLPYDVELWKAMVDQGWTGIAAPEDAGGVGLGWVEVAVLAEAVGAHVAPAPIVQSMIAVDALRDTPLIDPVLAGDDIACVAVSGRREVVPYVASADIAVCRRGDELVVADLREQRPAREPAMDVTREVGWLDPDALVGAQSIGGDAALQRFVDHGATAYAAELLGAAHRMLDESTEYAKERVQFDRPIGSFQAVKHRLADMLVDVEGMRSAVYWAAWCIAADHADASVAASTAKVWCSDAARRVVASALQVHGGIGFTWEHDVHLYMKRVQLDALAFGDATAHRTRLAQLLRAKLDAGESVL